MHFISHADKPRDRPASYCNPQVRVKVKEGVVKRRVRGTYGGDRSDYTGDRSSGTAALQTIKLHLNHVVSSDLSYMTMDISDYYLGTPLDRLEYMLINRHDIPEDIQERYATAIHLVNDKAMVRVTKALYGIPQAGRLSQERLIPHLAQHGHTLCKNTPCLSGTSAAQCLSPSSSTTSVSHTRPAKMPNT